MPGRTYTAQAPKPQQPKRKRKQQKRLLDAFSIAQHEVPEKVKIRKNRLGEIEEAPAKRRRDDSGDEDSEDEESETAPRSKRSRRDREEDIGNSGSDGEGNRWVTGRVASDDESSIDSDEAFGDSDEEGPKAARKDTSKSGRRAKHDPDSRDSDHDVDLDEDEDDGSPIATDSDDESEGFAADAVDLADILDQRDSESEEEDYASTKRKPRTTQNTNGSESEGEDESDLSISDDENDNDDSAKLRALQDLVTSLDAGKSSNNARVAPPDAQETMAPTDYGINPTQKLTIADLLPTVSDPKLRKSLRAIADDGKRSKSGSVPQKLDVPLAKRQQDRIDRSVAFEKSKEALSRWIDTVKHNRRAEHLQFPLPDPDAASAKDTSKLQLTSQSKPRTDLESTIQDILFQSGLAAHDGQAGEDQIQAYEELATNKMPLEEAQARQAELRKHRALLFREEIKAKRIKKIKSKAYRRVHRKEREKNALKEHEALIAAGVEPSEDERERMHRQRAEERMGAKHRESKWAKAVKNTGRGAWDEDARTGITEMARREEELRRRIQGKEVTQDDMDSVSESSDDSSEDEDGQRFTSKIQDKLDSLNEPASANSGLASLAFMQKAEAARKARNEEDIQRLKRELNDEETPEEASDAEEMKGRRSYGPVKDLSSVARQANKQHNEFEEGSGSEHEEESQNERSTPAMKQAIARTQQPKSRHSSKSALSKSSTEAPQANGNPFTLGSKQSQPSENPFLMPAKRNAKHSLAGPETVTISTMEDIPVASTESQLKTAPRKLAKGKTSGTSSNKASQAAAVVSMRDQTEGNANNDDEEEETSSAGSDSDDSSPPAPTSRPLTNNKALMAQAFASDATLDANSFLKEKTSLSKNEAPQDLTPATLPGWGSWTGEGLSKAERRTNARRAAARRDYLSLTGKNKSSDGVAAGKRRDAKLEKVIVSEKRVPKNAKYLAGGLPLGFETRDQYERSLRVPVGPEWSTKETFQGATKPRLLVKGGVIKPMSKPLL